MKKSSTILFAIFLTLVLVFLVAINFLKDFSYLSTLSPFVIPSISTLLITLVILVFIVRELENNKIKKEFVAIITHKFKTPLTGVRWSIDMLQKDLTLLEKKDLLIEMKKANERLMEIVDLLVGYANFDKRLQYNFEAVSLKEIVDLSYNKYLAAIKNKNIQFSVDASKELPMVIADKSKIQFVVDMLIDNAVKYTPKDGWVSASFDVLMDGSVTLKISDTGIGMTYFDKKKLFKHFFRADNAKRVDSDGLGLGLYTAREIVCHHKGKLWAESGGINRGSTFYLRLPIKR